MKKPVLFIVGTRPEATKGWLFARNLAASLQVDLGLIFTGQHIDLINNSFRDLGPIEGVSIGRAVEDQLIEWPSKFADYFRDQVDRRSPAAACGLGDTNSVRLAAELSHKFGIPFIHLEAGIRHHGNYDKAEPEELNRRCVSSLATLHLAPTVEAVANLVRENIPISRIRRIGDLSACAITCAFQGLAERILDGEAAMIDRTSGPYVLCTFHRSTSLWAQEELLRQFIDTAQIFDDLMFVLVGRPDSRWADFYRRVDTISNIYVTPAMSPSIFLKHLLHCEFVLTDSAGVQQEAIILGREVVACRREIELYADNTKLHLTPPPFVELPDVVSRLWPAKRFAYRGEVEPRLSAVLKEGNRVAREMALSVEELVKGDLMP